MIIRNIKRAWITSFIVTPLFAIYPYYRFRKFGYVSLTFYWLGFISSIAGIYAGFKNGY